MLDLRQYAGLDVGEFFARYTAAGRANACEIVLFLMHIAAITIAAPVHQIIGLKHHLVERIIPPHMPSVTPILIPACNLAVSRIKFWITLRDKRH